MHALIKAGAAAVAVTISASTVSADAAVVPARVYVQPIAGAHWQFGAGVPEFGLPGFAVVQTVRSVGHTPVARLVGLTGKPGSALRGLGFSAQTPVGIDPCWLVGVRQPDGTAVTLHLTTDGARNGGTQPPPSGDRAPFTVWTWTFTVPAGDTITSVTAEVMTSEQPPPVGDRVAFDEFTVNGSPAIGL